MMRRPGRPRKGNNATRLRPRNRQSPRDTIATRTRSGVGMLHALNLRQTTLRAHSAAATPTSTESKWTMGGPPNGTQQRTVTTIGDAPVHRAAKRGIPPRGRARRKPVSSPTRQQQPKTKRKSTSTNGVKQQRQSPPPSALRSSVHSVQPLRAVPRAEDQHGKMQWVQCDNKGCSKWRPLPPTVNVAKLPAIWKCYMHPWPQFKSCAHPEEKYELHGSHSWDGRVIVADKRVANASLWVQCERSHCRKWRPLPAYAYASQLPKFWTCDLHPISQLASCDAPNVKVEDDQSHPKKRAAKRAEIVLGEEGSGLQKKEKKEKSKDGEWTYQNNVLMTRMHSESITTSIPVNLLPFLRDCIMSALTEGERDFLDDSRIENVLLAEIMANNSANKSSIQTLVVKIISSLRYEINTQWKVRYSLNNRPTKRIESQRRDDEETNQQINNRAVPMMKVHHPSKRFCPRLKHFLELEPTEEPMESTPVQRRKRRRGGGGCTYTLKAQDLPLVVDAIIQAGKRKDRQELDVAIFRHRSTSRLTRAKLLESVSVRCHLLLSQYPTLTGSADAETEDVAIPCASIPPDLQNHCCVTHEDTSFREGSANEGSGNSRPETTETTLSDWVVAAHDLFFGFKGHAAINGQSSHTEGLCASFLVVGTALVKFLLTGSTRHLRHEQSPTVKGDGGDDERNAPTSCTNAAWTHATRYSCREADTLSSPANAFVDEEERIWLKSVSTLNLPSFFGDKSAVADASVAWKRDRREGLARKRSDEERQRALVEQQDRQNREWTPPAGSCTMLVLSRKRKYGAKNFYLAELCLTPYGAVRVRYFPHVVWEQQPEVHIFMLFSVDAYFHLCENNSMNSAWPYGAAARYCVDLLEAKYACEDKTNVRKDDAVGTFSEKNQLDNDAAKLACDDGADVQAQTLAAVRMSAPLPHHNAVLLQKLAKDGHREIGGLCFPDREDTTQTMTGCKTAKLDVISAFPPLPEMEASLQRMVTLSCDGRERCFEQHLFKSGDVGAAKLYYETRGRGEHHLLHSADQDNDVETDTVDILNIGSSKAELMLGHTLKSQLPLHPMTDTAQRCGVVGMFPSSVDGSTHPTVPPPDYQSSVDGSTHPTVPPPDYQSSVGGSTHPTVPPPDYQSSVDGSTHPTVPPPDYQSSVGGSTHLTVPPPDYPRGTWSPPHWPQQTPPRTTNSTSPRTPVATPLSLPL